MSVASCCWKRVEAALRELLQRCWCQRNEGLGSAMAPAVLLKQPSPSKRPTCLSVVEWELAAKCGSEKLQHQPAPEERVRLSSWR